MRVTHVGTIDPYIAAAFSPNASTLYVNHDGSEVIAYTYPELVAGATVATPDDTGEEPGELGNIACDSAGVLYWWDMTHGNGCRLYKSSDPISFYSTDPDLEDEVGLCWSPYDGLLYGFGMVDITEGQVLSSWDPDVPGGDRQLVYDPPSSSDLWDWPNSTVPTPNGHLWWVMPHSNPAAYRIRHWSVPDADSFSTVEVITDAVVPFRDNRVYFYGDPPGGYYYDANHDAGPADPFDVISPGQRAAAYTPAFNRVCFERGDTGEVWEIAGGGWRLGAVGWS